MCAAAGDFKHRPEAPRVEKRPGPRIVDNLVLRDFSAERPNQVWLTDMIEHQMGEGTLYVFAVKDVCSRRIVGWAIGERILSKCADTALRTAIARRRPSRTVIVHSGLWRAVQVTSPPAGAARPRAHRFHGPRRHRGRQRDDGVVLRAPAAERAQRPDLANT